MPVDKRVPDPRSYPQKWFGMDPQQALDYAAGVSQEVGLEEPFRIAVVGDHFPVFGVAAWWGDGCHGINVKPLTKDNIRHAIIEARNVRAEASHSEKRLDSPNPGDTGSFSASGE